MNVLVACEESQRVCISFRERGYNAFSCDIQECSGGHPEWHIKGNVLPILNGYGDDPTMFFRTQDGKPHPVPMRWDLIIAHPPCTYLTVTGNRWFNEERYGEKARERKKERERAIDFFMAFANANCPRIAIENPVGVISTVWRKPDQIIQPWQFSDDPEEAVSKATCLWLKGVSPLVPIFTTKPEIEYKVWYDAKAKRWKRQSMWHYKAYARGNKNERAKERSKTFWGIARAMAEQWGSGEEQLRLTDL